MTDTDTALYLTATERRNSAWRCQSIFEQAAPIDPEEIANSDANAREAWWHAQGRAEAFAEIMTALEQTGRVDFDAVREATGVVGYG